ncbi:MAG: efflux RND transporter permease subunit [Elusimicrobiota bacterium]
MSIVELGIKKPVTTLMLACSIIIFALVGFKHIPVELYPNYEFGEVSIISHLRGGIPASEVEKYVTRPMEEVFSEVNGVKDMTSASREAESVIILKFFPETNLNFTILDIREKLATIRHRLPREMERPVIAKFQQSDVPVMIITLASDSYTPEQLREIAEDKIKERFLRISGVANIEIGGGRERKILIEVDNAKLVSYGLPILSVIEKINLSNISVSAGEIEKFNERYTIRATGEYKDIDEIKSTAVAVTERGSVVRLGEIAEVKDSYYEPSSFARLNLHSVVSVYIQKETIANTLSVAKNLLKEIEKLKNLFGGEVNFTVVKNDADFINQSISSLKSSLVYSAILVGVVLMAFLKSFRSVLVIIFIVPVSLCITVVLMYMSKLSFNIMTLSGLGLGVGMLVDNAIIILENIVGHFQKEKDKTKLVVEATEQLFMPILASTLTTIIVFLPLVFLEPEVKKLYVPFGLAITYSLIASLVCSIIFIPPLVLKLVKNLGLEKSVWEKNLLAYFISGLKFVFRKPKEVLLVTAALTAITFYVFMTRESEFMETTELDTFRIGIQFPPATRIERSDGVVKEIEKEVLLYPQVERVTSKVEKLHTFVEVKVKKDVDYVKDDFRKKFEKFMPAFLYYQPSQSLSSKEVFVDFYGYDYSILKQLAFLSSGRLAQVKTLSDVKIRMREDEPEITVNVDRNKLGLFKLTALYLANTLHGQIRGLVATYYRTAGKEIETICRLLPESVKSEAELKMLKFVSPNGDVIALNQVSDINKVNTQQEIWHKNKKRFIQISANRRDAGLSTAVQSMDKELKTLKFPKDYFYKFSGEYEDMVRNKKQFIFALCLTAILIYVTIAALFESYSQPFIIMLSIPLGLIGVAILLLVFKKPISLGVWIGLMMLGGVVANSAIVMVEKMNIYKKEVEESLRKQGLPAQKDGNNLLKVIFETPETYFSEVIMTSITTILGVLPLILNTSESATMWRTLGLTIFGGMLSSSIFVLFLVPLAYFGFEKVSNKIKNVFDRLRTSFNWR